MLSSLRVAHRLAATGLLLVAAVVALLAGMALGADRHPPASARHSGPAASTSPTSAPSVKAPLPLPTVRPSVQTRLPLATVRVPAAGASIGVPQSFLGVSTEYWTIPIWANHLSVLGRVLSTITPYGPLVLRIGGSSADQAFWAPTEAPEWVFEVRRWWLDQVSRIVKRFGVRVILDLNQVTATPQIAVGLARAAELALPSESVVGFEIGNESDIYSQASWRRITGGVDSRALPLQMTAAGYASSYLTYANALARVDRGIPLLGPALSEPATHLSWITGLLAAPHPRLRAVTVHRYPLSACSHRGSPTFPTVARVLSESATAGMAKTIGGAVRAARRAGLPVRLTEINSVTCGGRQGVSNTFSTALWAPDALFELLRAGATYAAVHVRARAVNMAFSLTNHGLIANPLLYGLSLFSKTLGANPQLLPLRLNTRPSLHLKAWAVRVNTNTLHVLLINKGSRAARVSLKLPAAGPAAVQRLLARTARSTSGVTLGGQHLDPSGRWAGKQVLQTIPRSAGGYQVTVRGISAALVTTTLKPGALTLH